MTVETIKPIDLTKMSQAELDKLYKNSPVGVIPDGDSRGTVVTVGGFQIGEFLASLINLLAWQGKVFERDQEFLLNKLTIFSFHLVKAQVYRGESWLCQGESIILDYTKTSFVAQKIRDEIREVAPGVYLGNAYWGDQRVLSFTLQF